MQCDYMAPIESKTLSLFAYIISSYIQIYILCYMYSNPLTLKLHILFNAIKLRVPSQAHIIQGKH